MSWRWARGRLQSMQFCTCLGAWPGLGIIIGTELLMTKLFHSFPHSSSSPFPALLLRFQLVQVLSLTLIFAWKKYQTTTKPSPQKPHTKVWVLVSNVFISDSPFETWVLLQMALRQCTSSHCQVSFEHCPYGQSEGKRICVQVPQVTTDPHSPKVPFSPLQWEVSCFILCCS